MTPPPDSTRTPGRSISTLTRPRCPDCGCPRFHAYKSVRNGEPGSDDDSLTRYSRCLDCGRKVVVVVE